jgi:hypothetical protein
MSHRVAKDVIGLKLHPWQSRRAADLEPKKEAV